MPALLGSCKWDRTADARVLGQLKRNAEALGPAARRVTLVVFARGFDDDLRDQADREDVRLVGAADLF